MRIGIDFGTSYSAAAAMVDGKPQSILFGGKPEFRTAVFFSHELDENDEMTLTPALERELDALVKIAAASQKKALKDYQQKVAAAEKLNLAKARERSLAMLISPRLQSADELRSDALRTVQRQWLERRRQQARNLAPSIGKAIFGEEAFEAYYAGTDGRLLHSPKSMLGYNLVGDAENLIGWVARRIFSHIRAVASEQLGVDVRSAVIGRPVEFKSSLGAAGTVKALERIERAARAAGLDEIEFLEEPSAAAIEFHSECRAPRKAIVVDIGGGTTDIAVALVGQAASAPAILGTRGFAKGGDDIDLDFSIANFMPVFGKDRCSVTPTHYYNAAMINDQDRQRDFRRADYSDVLAPFANRLSRLQEPAMTTLLAQKVEALKVQLSSSPQSQADLDFIEPGLAVPANHAALDLSSSAFMNQLEQEVLRCVDHFQHAPELVFLTGGMSQAPFVHSLLATLFPQAQIVRSNPKLGVVNGLARFAAG